MHKREIIAGVGTQNKEVKKDDVPDNVVDIRTYTEDLVRKKDSGSFVASLILAVLKNEKNQQKCEDNELHHVEEDLNEVSSNQAWINNCDS